MTAELKHIRRGFYNVELADGTAKIAEWAGEKPDLAWYEWVAPAPYAEKVPVLLTGTVVRTLGQVAPAKVAQYKERELSPEEAADKLYAESSASLLRNLSLMSSWSGPPPAHRVFKAGDSVCVGSLVDVVVFKSYENGSVYVVHHTDTPRRGDANFSEGPRRVMGVWHWTDVFPHVRPSENGKYEGYPELRDSPLWGVLRTVDLGSILSTVQEGVNASPDFQRGYVWTDADKDAYLDSIFMGRDLGRFIFERSHDSFDPPLVLDGKQRVDCLRELVTDRRRYKGFLFSELPKNLRYAALSRSVQMAIYERNQLDRVSRLELFLAVNAAGVPQTREHLAHVERLLEQAIAEKAAREAAQKQPD